MHCGSFSITYVILALYSCGTLPCMLWCPETCCYIYTIGKIWLHCGSFSITYVILALYSCGTLPCMLWCPETHCYIYTIGKIWLALWFLQYHLCNPSSISGLHCSCGTLPCMLWCPETHCYIYTIGKIWLALWFLQYHLCNPSSIFLWNTTLYVVVSRNSLLYIYYRENLTCTVVPSVSPM